MRTVIRAARTCARRSFGPCLTACLCTGAVIVPGCGDDKPTPPPQPPPPTTDITPPATIQDLALTGPPGREVRLTWTSPGDDGATGRAARYEIRYAAGVLTDSSWSSAAMVPSVPLPKVGGRAEALTLTAMPLGRWFLGIRTADEVPNWSGLSNQVEAIVADFVAPAPVTDLRVVSEDTDAIILAWTAPGNDGAEGRAARYDLRSSSSVIREQNWDDAVPVPMALVPDTAGAIQQWTVSDLEPERTWHFALKTEDDAANWSTISNDVMAQTVDRVAPAEIRDLTLQGGDAGHLVLAWTATGDNGSLGRAAAYDLRRSTAWITEDNWEQATPVDGVPRPGPSGTAEMITVPGLPSGVMQYFALQAIDDAGQRSGLSNPLGVLPGERPIRRLTYSGTARGIWWRPDWSPDGREIVFSAIWGASLAEIYRVPSVGGSVVRLTSNPGDDYSPAWSPDGTRILYIRSESGGNPNELWTMDPRDPSIRSRVTQHSGRLLKDCVWSPDDTQIAYTAYRFSPPEIIFEIWTVPAAGSGRRLLTETGRNGSPSWSPDGTKVAFHSDRAGDYDLWVKALAEDDPVRLTDSAANDMSPDWSPDGNWIAFASNRAGSLDLWLMSTTSDQFIQLTTGMASDQGPSWSPDGRQIAFTSNREADPFTFDIWILPLE